MNSVEWGREDANLTHKSVEIGHSSKRENWELRCRACDCAFLVCFKNKCYHKKKNTQFDTKLESLIANFLKSLKKISVVYESSAPAELCERGEKKKIPKKNSVKKKEVKKWNVARCCVVLVYAREKINTSGKEFRALPITFLCSRALKSHPGDKEGSNACFYFHNLKVWRRYLSLSPVKLQWAIKCRRIVRVSIKSCTTSKRIFNHGALLMAQIEKIH